MADDSKPVLTTVTLTNTAMLEGLKNPGNAGVWEDFVNRYRPMILRYAKRFGLSDADADDAAQQTLVAFCTAYQEGKYQREKGRLRVWLFGIARNQLLNLRRREACHGAHEVQIINTPNETTFFGRVGDENEMEQAWDEEWRDSVLRQCLEEVRREFDAKTIQAFELFAWKGKPAEEVARELETTSNAVFIAKHRVMKRIRELLPAMEEVW